MDFKALQTALLGNREYPFAVDVTIDGIAQQYTMVFTLRNPTSKESKDFLAESARVDWKGGAARISDVSHGAPLRLLHKLLVKKECFNGTADREPLPDDLWESMTDEFKRNLIALHQNKIRGEETEILKN